MLLQRKRMVFAVGTPYAQRFAATRCGQVGKLDHLLDLDGEDGTDLLERKILDQPFDAGIAYDIVVLVLAQFTCINGNDMLRAVHVLQ